MEQHFTWKTFIILLSSFFFTRVSMAQDTIVKMNNTRIVAKILEINPKTVKYKRFDYPDGPLIIIDKRHVSRIHYANGSVDTLSMKPIKPTLGLPKTDPRIKDYGKNQISLVVTDLFFGMGTIGYERIFYEGKFGFKIPVSFNFLHLDIADTINYNSYHEHYSNTWDGTGYYYENKVFSTGLELYYYTGGQGTLRYFIGPSVEYTQFKYYYYNGPYQYPYYGHYKVEDGYYFAFFMKNGLNYQFSKNLNFSVNGGVGFFAPHTKYEDDNFDNPHTTLSNSLAIELGISVGYRF